MDRRGIISAGTWLVDNVKIIGQYPARGNLTTITRVETGLGGCSHNVLADLAGLGLGAALPLYAGGCIGRDAFGSYIEREIERLGIDAGNMQVGDMMAFIQYTMQIIAAFLMISLISVMLPRASVSARNWEPPRFA